MHTLALIISLVVLSHSAIFIRFAAASAIAIGFWRLVISLPVLGFFLLAKGEKIPDFKKDRGIAIIACAFFLFLHWYTWFLSVQKTSVANSMVLFSLNPIFTAVGAWIFFKERIRYRHVFSMLCCMVGVYFLVRKNLGTSNIAGDIYGLFCSMFFSGYILISKRIRKYTGNLPFTFFTYTCSSLFFLLLMVWKGIPFLGYNQTTWLAYLGLAFGSTLMGHALFTYCLQYFNINFMSIITLSEPIISALSAYLIFSEKITADGILGFTLVAVGVVVLVGAHFIEKIRP